MRHDKPVLTFKNVLFLKVLRPLKLTASEAIQLLGLQKTKANEV
jgi:hypothetical protein